MLKAVEVEKVAMAVLRVVRVGRGMEVRLIGEDMNRRLAALVNINMNEEGKESMQPVSHKQY
jgi:hypothetical protein